MMGWTSFLGPTFRLRFQDTARLWIQEFQPYLGILSDGKAIVVDYPLRTDF